MSKLLFATALVVAFSLPALATGGKFKPKQRYIAPAIEQQLKSDKASRKSDRDKVDPYWTPCNYQSAWECGGDMRGTPGNRSLPPGTPRF
jgi:hypothetical protein